MSDFLTVVKDNALAITTLVGVFTIIGAGLGFWLNFRLSRKKLESDKKALRQQMITNNIAPMRQEWINDLRTSATQYIDNMKHILSFEKYKDFIQSNTNNNEFELRRDKYLKRIERVVYISTYMSLLLPFKNEKNTETLAENVRNTLTKIEIFLSIPEPTQDEIKQTNILLDKLINDFRFLLKEEWNKTKELKEIE
ncbi:TPA: hypothetical protein PC505_002453 [Morganella morganii]|nr:hypothetical protein [Morganella morganii]HDF2364410.1 hypothetical protein [Morganella morganii]HDF2423032.1 hypothetical protein [Morganella morganii]